MPQRFHRRYLVADLVRSCTTTKAGERVLDLRLANCWVTYPAHRRRHSSLSQVPEKRSGLVNITYPSNKKGNISRAHGTWVTSCASLAAHDLATPPVCRYVDNLNEEIGMR